MSKDNINNPSHYVMGGIEPIEFIESNDLSFFQWAIIKYVFRYKYKNGLEDLKKAEFFIKRMIKNEENKLNIWQNK